MRREAIADGYTDKRIRALVRSGEWHRLRQGAYCVGETWDAADDIDQHLILACAVLRTTPGPVALSHVSALAVHGVDLWGADLSRVHLTRLDDNHGCVAPDVVHHQGVLVVDDLTMVRGALVTTVPRAVIEAATGLSLESSLVSANAALHAEKCSEEELWRYFNRAERWPGSQAQQLMIRMLDRRAASAAETRTLMMLFRAQVEKPELQWPVYDEGGYPFAYVDFCWPDRGVILEFDGKAKYTRHLRPGEEPGDAVFREKRREDRIRQLTGFTMIRIVWADLEHPARAIGLIRSALRRARSAS